MSTNNKSKGKQQNNKENTTSQPSTNTQKKEDKKQQNKNNTTQNKNETTQINKVSKPRAPSKQSEHFLAIIYGGNLRTTDFIMVKDEDKKYGIEHYFKKLRGIIENNFDDKRILKSTVFYVQNSNDLYNKFIERCQTMPEGSDTIYCKDNTDETADEILKNIHLIHGKSVGYIQNIIKNIIDENKMEYSKTNYPPTIKSYKPRQPRQSKPVEPQKPTSEKANIDENDDELPKVSPNVKKNNSKSTSNTKQKRRPVQVDQNDDDDDDDDDEMGELNDDITNEENENEEDENGNESEEENEQLED